MNIRFLNQTLFIIIVLLSISCTGKKFITLEPAGYDQVSSVTIDEGSLRAVFVDNGELPPFHRKGYNGIAELYHSGQDSNIFVPAYAGFNLEHIFNGDSLIQFFEPRVNEMMLYRKSNNEVLLYQPVTPVSKTESLTEFKVVEPYYIDITFKCLFHDNQYFTHGYAGFFWASYINKPPDRRIFFRGMTEGGSETWIDSFSEVHGIKSTHRSLNDKHDLFFAPDFNISLASHFSGYRYTLPFYFGRFHNMALGFLFRSSEIIRLTQSPSGGGVTNPAWDFQYIIPDPETGKVYTFSARLVYKPFAGNQDMLDEYNSWAKE